MRTFQGALFCTLLLLNFLSGATTIEIWHQRLESVDFWPKVINNFQKENPDIQIKVSVIPTEELKLAVVRTVYQNHAPDIVLAPSDYIGKYQQMKLSPVATTYLNRNQHPRFAPTTELNGLNYGIPLVGGNHLLLYYNKKFVKKAATTWREIIEQQPEFTSKGINTVALKYNDMSWFASFITAYGGFPVEGDKITLDTQAVIDALIFYKGLSQQKLVSVDCTYDCVTTDFYKQKYAYIINGDWAYKEATQHLGDDLAVTTIPKIGEEIVHPLFSSLALIFPNQVLTGNKAIAIKKFTDYLQTQKVQKQLYDVTGLMPTHSKAMQTIEQQASGNRLAVLEQLSIAVAIPPNQAMSAAWVGMAQGFKLFINNKVEAQKTAKLMQKIAQRELDKMRLEP